MHVDDDDADHSNEKKEQEKQAMEQDESSEDDANQTLDPKEITAIKDAKKNEEAEEEAAVPEAKQAEMLKDTPTDTAKEPIDQDEITLEDEINEEIKYEKLSMYGIL